MRKNRIYFIIRKRILIVSLLLCCFTIFTNCNTRDNNGDDSLLKKEFYSNGKLKSEGIFINDSVKNGWYKTYFETGVIKEEKNYILGKKNGSQKTYFENGSLEKDILFKEGVQHGKAVGYYENGKIKSKGYWQNGKGYGNTLFYYINGTLKQYSCYDLFGETMYVIKWDSLGNKIKEEGLAISINRQINYPSDSVPLEKELVLYYTAAQPPNYTTVVKIKEVNSKGEKLNEQIYPIVENTVTFKRIFNQTGKYKIVAIGEIKDLKGDTITIDTIETEITVI